jgi:hypothetical protein
MLAAPSRLSVVVSSLGLAFGAPAFAADYVVTRYDDPAPDGCLADDCSLREAVIDANQDQDLDRILLSAGTYELTLANVAGDEDLAATGDLDLTSNLELLGPGATMTTIDANQTDRVLHLLELLSPDAPTYLIRGVRLTGGAHVFGAALLIQRNVASVEECEIVGNGTSSSLAAVTASLFATLTLRHTTVAGNAQNGILASQAAVTLENSTVSGNGTPSARATSGGTLDARHSTIVAAASTDTAASATGTDSKIQLRSSVVVGQCHTATGGVIQSFDGNIESPGATCGLAQGSDLANVALVDLDLSALDDFGGPTRTHVPGAASPANGRAADALCLFADDQRGAARSTSCESGAVERTGGAVATPVFADDFQQGSADAWSDAVGD